MVSEHAALGRNRVREPGPGRHGGHGGYSGSLSSFEAHQEFAVTAGVVMTHAPQRLRATMSP
ncbi:hypothetical protein QF030_001009 [Streptomyces rishiriensis]|uniref:Uncharacterized protein n=1 Tax=Streptomyces rishiriensis TaxID=68264 RepID=A0ABU0NIA4_STRRH|nr:hypothetical protein [Streptomyces rishiriensis]